nr:VENN motif pre-toxin domain-containing protein [Halomonas denitrificans]
MDQADKGRLLVMNSQIIGVIAAEIASNDDSELQIGAQVAGSATQYNYLSHWQKEQRSQELEACQSLSCKAERNDYWTEVDQLQDSAYHSGMVSGVPEALYESADDLLALFDGDTYAAMAALLQEDNIIVTLIESAAQDYAERLETYQREYERAGADGAYNAGV